MENEKLENLIKKYELTNINENTLKIIRFFDEFNLLTLQENEKLINNNAIEFACCRLCDNQKKDIFWSLVFSYIYNIEKSQNTITWNLFYSNLRENIKVKCSRCHLKNKTEKCPFKILANIVNVEKIENLEEKELLQYILKKPETNSEVTIDFKLDTKNIDMIALKASEVLAKSEMVTDVQETKEGKIEFKYFDLENTKVNNFLPLMFDKTQYKEDQFSIDNIEEQIKMQTEYFAQSPYRLAAYIIYKCQKENIDIYKFYKNYEKQMMDKRDEYYSKNAKYKIHHMPYNQEVKILLEDLTNYIINTIQSRKSVRIPINIILYTTDPNIIKEITTYINRLVFYYGYIKNSKINNISTNAILSDYRSLKNYYYDLNENGQKKQPNFGINLISDFTLVNYEKYDFKMRILNLLEECMHQYENDLITVISGKKEVIDEILANNSSLKHLFNIKFEFKDLDEKEVLDITTKNLEKIANTTEEFKKALQEYIRTTYREEELKSKEYANDLSNKIIYNYFKNEKVCKNYTIKDLPVCERKRNMEEILENLNELTGLHNIKEEINNLVELLEFHKKIESKDNVINLHMLFKGNPGTGKTTVARIMADIFYQLGYINTNKLIEVEAKDLIGEYLGQTGPKTYRVIEKALDGVLFIDEAYTLTTAKGTANYSMECISTLIKAMEEYKGRLIMIFAGYKDEMNDFVRLNPGILSRIGYDIEFKDYIKEELLEIFMHIAKKRGFEVEPQAQEKVKKVIEKAINFENFGNARFIVNFFDKTLLLHARNTKNLYNKEELTLITSDDIDIELMEKNLRDANKKSGKIGFSIG